MVKESGGVGKPFCEQTYRRRENKIQTGLRHTVDNMERRRTLKCPSLPRRWGGGGLSTSACPSV